MCDTKKCSKCGEVKGLGEFPPHLAEEDGKNKQCRICWREEIDKKRLREIYQRSIQPKTCTQCQIIKPADCYAANKRAKDGLRSNCKDCWRNWYEAKLTEKWGSSNPKCIYKKCIKCGQEKPRSAFALNRKSRYGIKAQCIDCTPAKIINRDRKRQVAAKSYLKNCEKRKSKVREWREKNPERAALQSKLWAEENPERRKAADNERRRNLPPDYVAKLIGMKVSESPPALIALKREQLAIKRMARELKKAATKPTGDKE